MVEVVHRVDRVISRLIWVEIEKKNIEKNGAQPVRKDIKIND